MATPPQPMEGGGGPRGGRRGTLLRGLSTTQVRATLLPGTREQRRWYNQMRLPPIVLSLLWILIPLDPDPVTGVVDPFLFSFLMHAIYAAIAAGVGVSLYALALPLPSKATVAGIVAGVAAVDSAGVLAVQLAGEGYRLLSTMTQTILRPVCLIVSALVLIVPLWRHAKRTEAADGSARGDAGGAATALEGGDGARAASSAKEIAARSLSRATSASSSGLAGRARALSRASKAIEEGDILPSSQVYLNLVKAFCLLFVVYYFGQVFTYFFREQRMTMDDIERVGLLVVFQGFLGAARLAMMRIVQAKNMRTVHEPLPDGIRVVLLFGLEALGMCFQRNLFFIFTSAAGIVTALVQRAVVQLLMWPSRLLPAVHELINKARKCIKWKPADFRESATELCVQNFYGKLAEFVSLVTWLSFFLINRLGWNRAAYPYVEDLARAEGVDVGPPNGPGWDVAPDFATLFIYLGLFAAFELLLLVLVRGRAAVLGIDIFENALAPMSRPKERLAFVLLGTHVVQDVWVALARTDIGVV